MRNDAFLKKISIKAIVVLKLVSSKIRTNNTVV